MKNSNKNLTNLDIETLSTTEPSRMSVHRRSQYLTEKIKEFVHNHPDEGVSTSLVAERFGITLEIARKHLENLSKLREIYSTNVNKYVKVYYPNGRLIHPFLQKKVDFGSRVYKFSINQLGNKEILHIQEKKFNLLTGETTEGGILVDVDKIDKFINELQDLIEKLKEVKNAR